MKHIPTWLIAVFVLLLCSVPLRFALRGYSYIAHTLVFAAALLTACHVLPALWWRIVAGLVCLGLLYFVAVEIPIVAAARGDKDAGRDYLIVLGAAVEGKTPSLSLIYRMDAAIDYLNANPSSVAIVSGGQGEHEDITEAQCMFDYMTARGIAPERIIQEDKATSTMENLQFSFAIIRERGEEPDGNVAVLSSSYHLFRAKQMAKRLGVSAAGVPCYPGWPLLAANFYIREAFGITHLMVFGN